MTAKNIKIGHLNCHSIRNKLCDIINLINSEELDILCLNETFLKPSDTHLNSITGYNIIRNDRSHKKGGGVAIIIKKHIKYKIIHKISTTSTEYITIQLTNSPNNLNLSSVYTHPQSQSNLEFINQLAIGNSIILGDFNAHNSKWHSSHNNTLGNNLATMIDRNNLDIINDA